MLIKRPPRWMIPESLATPERVYLNRRQIFGLGAAAALAACGPGETATKADAAPAPPGPPTDAEAKTATLYPARRSERFMLDRPITDEMFASTYNNFYEFGSHKAIHRAAQKLPLRPWSVTIDGEVESPRTVDIDTLIQAMPLEERLYRHRCVERWAMAIPWTGFAMRAFIDFARPLSSAKYVLMETFLNPDVAPGHREFWYPWPYTEGLTIAEATNDLAFLVTGAYGKPAAPQFGAPLRLAVPWKYGFKSIKSIVRFSFTSVRPKTFWGQVGPGEYGFWANVNPDVPHPRWSQAEERMLGTDETYPTQLFNGYAEEVAGLYAGLEGEMLFR